MITLYNVIDIRTGQRYSIVRVKENKARWFVAADEEPGDEP